MNIELTSFTKTDFTDSMIKECIIPAFKIQENSKFFLNLFSNIHSNCFLYIFLCFLFFLYIWKIIKFKSFIKNFLKTFQYYLSQEISKNSSISIKPNKDTHHIIVSQPDLFLTIHIFFCFPKNYNIFYFLKKMHKNDIKVLIKAHSTRIIDNKLENEYIYYYKRHLKNHSAFQLKHFNPQTVSHFGITIYSNIKRENQKILALLGQFEVEFSQCLQELEIKINNIGSDQEDQINHKLNIDFSGSFNINILSIKPECLLFFYRFANKLFQILVNSISTSSSNEELIEKNQR